MMTSTRVTWTWNESDDPWSNRFIIKWTPYSPTENELIETAFLNQSPKVELENYEIDLKNFLQILRRNRHCQRQIYRHVLREDRFLLEPITPKISVQSSYVSCYSLFILECQRQKIVTRKQLENSKTRCLIIEMAAKGIIDEGCLVHREDHTKSMADELLQKKFSTLAEIYACIIELYTKDSFLYALLNLTLRLAEDNLPIEQQYQWKEKLRTLGPLAMILDCALSHYSTRKAMIVYRTAKLDDHEIEQYKNMNFLQCGYFSGFTSCSRSLEQAVRFNGNILFIIHLPKRHLSISARQGLTDVERFSAIPQEQEVLMRPATLFQVNSVKLNPQTKRHDIHLTIM